MVSEKTKKLMASYLEKFGCKDAENNYEIRMYELEADETRLNYRNKFLVVTARCGFSQACNENLLKYCEGECVAEVDNIENYNFCIHTYQEKDELDYHTHTLYLFKEKINEEDFGLLFWMLGGKEQFNKIEDLFL